MKKETIEKYKDVAKEQKVMGMNIVPVFIFEHKTGIISVLSDGNPKMVKEKLDTGKYKSFLHIAEATMIGVKFDKEKAKKIIKEMIKDGKTIPSEPPIEKKQEEVIVVIYSEKGGKGFINTIPYKFTESYKVIFDEEMKIDENDKNLNKIGGELLNMWGK